MKAFSAAIKKARRSKRGRAASAPKVHPPGSGTLFLDAAASQAKPAFSRQEEQQFTALVEENLPWAKSFARGFWVSDSELAVFEALRKTLIRFDPTVASFSTLLRRVLVGELIDMLRSDVRWHRLLVPLAENLEPVDETAFIHMDRAQLRDWLRAALRRLPAAEQKLLRLKYEEDLSLKEILERL